MSTQQLVSKESYQVVNRICAGIDVHRDFVSVTIISETPDHVVRTDYREFQTIKSNLFEMRKWLVEHNCTVAGMESTGKYWFPVYFALEDAMKVYVYNARNMRNIPGKKTDKGDSEWIAKITRHELLMSSYIPDKQIRDARLLARNRKSLVQQRSAVRQRLLGILDSAGIKLSSIASDVFGTSGRNLIRLLMSGEPVTSQKVEKLVFGPLRDKADKLMLAMEGYLRETHVYLLEQNLSLEAAMTNQIADIEAKLVSFLLDTPGKKAVFERIVQIPGFSQRSALLLLSEVGFDLKTFPSGKNFCSWAGLAPGKKESAGRNMSGKIQVRQRYLKALFIEVALASTRCKDTFLRAKYYSLKPRTGANKAVVAIAHYQAEAVYRAIKEGLDYRELTGDYVSMSQMNKDLKHLSRITGRLGKESVMEFIRMQTE